MNVGEDDDLSLSTLSQKSATICRRKVRLSPNSATVAVVSPFSATVAELDSRTFLRQCGQGLTRAESDESVGLNEDWLKCNGQKRPKVVNNDA